MNVLVIVAHPDDEVLGCGGTIAKLAGEGHDVFAAILGEGITSRSETRDTADDELLDRLRNDCHRAAELLGIRELVMKSLPDNRFDERPLLEVVKVVEDIMEKVNPSVIYTHSGGDLNIDHAVTFRAVLTAARPTRGTALRRVLSCEVPSSTEWAFQRFSPVFRPTVFEDISGMLEKKIRAMELYESEARSFPHPRSPEALRALALTRGSTVGVEAAEAFELVWELRGQ